MIRLALIALALAAAPVHADAHRPGCDKYPKATQAQQPDCAD